MELKEEIQNALKAGNAIIGYRRTIRHIKSKRSKSVVMANNTPDDLKKEIAHNAKITDTGIETFNGSSVELGVFCGKPFPVTVLTIK